MAGFLKLLLRNVLAGPSTDPYPLGPTFSPDSIRGRAVVDPERCVGCGTCVYVCAAGAINIQHTETGHTITVWENSCCHCASCAKYCPMDAITLSPDWHTAHAQEEKYRQVEQKTITNDTCPVCGKPHRAIPPDMAEALYSGKDYTDPANTRILCPECRRMAYGKAIHERVQAAGQAKA